MTRLASIIIDQYHFCQLSPGCLSELYTLFNYFDVNALLTEQQYGFRTKHSTELAAIKLVDFVIMEMNKKYSVKTPTAIFKNLLKAFDNLRFNILLDKFKYYEITWISLMLIESYLTRRY